MNISTELAASVSISRLLFTCDILFNALKQVRRYTNGGYDRGYARGVRLALRLIRVDLPKGKYYKNRNYYENL